MNTNDKKHLIIKLKRFDLELFIFKALFLDNNFYFFLETGRINYEEINTMNHYHHHHINRKIKSINT